MGLVRAGRYSGNEAVHGRELLVRMLTKLETCARPQFKSLLAELAPGRRVTRCSYAANVIAVLAEVSPATLQRWGKGLPGAKATSTVDGECVAHLVSSLGRERPLPPVGDEDLPGWEPSVVEDLRGAPPAPMLTRAERVRRTEHPNYKLGMNLASLATLWAVEAWPKRKFEEFVAWAATRFPHEFGTLNNSARWITDFCLSLRSTLHTAMCSEIHAIVPATGMPSLLSRVVDVVSSKHGVSFFPIIYVYTSLRFGLQWCLVGCPCLENMKQGVAVGAPGAAIGSPSNAVDTDARWFRFHGGEVMVQAVHKCEDAVKVNRADRLFRIVLTVGDQAIQGPTSTKFSEKEAAADGVPCNDLAVGICAFHVSDCIGDRVDKGSAESACYDRLLRLLRQKLAYGTGRLILRAVAKRFESHAASYEGRAGAGQTGD